MGSRNNFVDDSKEYILTLRRQGKTSREISEILGVSKPTILSRLSLWLYENIDKNKIEKAEDYVRNYIDLDYISEDLELDKIVVLDIKKNLKIERKRLEHTDKRFYVYVHKTHDGGVVYVGSGSGSRYKSVSERSKEHRTIFKSLIKEIVKYGLTKAESLEEEQKLISSVGVEYLFNRKEKVGIEIDLNYETINKHFYYDESSPSCLKWKSGNCLGRKSRVAFGTNAGHLNQKGYWVVSLYRKTLRIHRIIYCLKHGDFDKHMVVDHINRDSTDNRINNLRLVSSSDNGKNKSLSKRNTTGVTGVCKQYENGNPYYSVSWSENGVSKSLTINPKTTFPFEDEETAIKSSFELAVFTRKLVEYMFYDKEFGWPTQ